MVLCLILAISRSETPGPNLLYGVTGQNCGDKGVCAACAAASDDMYPYWNGEACVRCVDVFPDEREFWDPLFRQCVAACPRGREAVYDNNVCRACEEVDPARPHWD